MTCLDDETVLGLVEGRLDAAVLTTLDAHLDSCVDCRGIVAQVSRVRGDGGVLPRGHALGRYVIGELLGSGAMGHVYSAWEPELDRRVAVKLLRSQGPRERLVREAQAMAKLDHPNVVTVHEVGTADEGVFVAMALVDGASLRAWSQAAHPWRDSLRVLVDVARGLAASHAAGVLHRDVKPDNVIVGRDGRARLGDFGLARSEGRVVEGDVLALGTPTSVAGTPAYMAPEVLRGGAATMASDQFGFGVTAYEVLAKQRPFGGASWSELVTAIETTTPAPIREVPGWIDDAIRRCLSPDPAKRWPDLASLASYLATRGERRRPAAMVASAAAFAAMASLVTAIATSGSKSAPTCALGDLEAPTDIAPAAVERWVTDWRTESAATCSSTEPRLVVAARQRCLAGRRDDLNALLAQARAAPDRPAASDRLIDALAARSPAECRLEPALPAGAAPTRQLARRALDSSLSAVRATIAIADAHPAVADAARLVDQARLLDDAGALADAQLVHAEALRMTSQLDAAALAARDALASAERAHDDLAAAQAWLARVAIASDQRDLVLADDFGVVAAGAIDRAGGGDRLHATLAKLRGQTAYLRGHFADARTFLADARTRFARTSGERSIDVAGIESARGQVERAAGDLDAAQRFLEAALAQTRALRGDSPELARDLHNLAGVLRLRGNLPAAEARYRESLAVHTRLRGPASVEAGVTHNSLALVALARNDLDTADAELATAHAALSAARHGDLAFTEHNLGLVAAARGQHTDARTHFIAAGTLYDRTIGADAVAPIRLLLDRAASELALGHRPAALALVARARAAGQTAHIDWIVADADAFTRDAAGTVASQVDPFSTPRPPRTPRPDTGQPIAAGRGTPVEAPAVERPDVTPKDVPIPPTTPDAPQPVKDIGVYGSSPRW